MSDHYDARTTPNRFAEATDSQADVVAEALRLSKEEHWDEAVSQVLENRGVYRHAKTELANRRMLARLKTADAVYEKLCAENLTSATAALAFLLPSAENWGSISRESVRKAEIGESVAQVRAPLSASAWGTLRRYRARYGFLFNRLGTVLLAILAVLPFTVGFAFIAAVSAAIYGAIAYGLWILSRRAKQQGQKHFCKVLALLACFTAIANLFIGEGMFAPLQLAAAGVVGFVLEKARKLFVTQLETLIKEQTGGGWFKPDLITVQRIDEITKETLGTSAPAANASDLAERVGALNTAIAAAPSTVGYTEKVVVSEAPLRAAFINLWPITGGVGAVMFIVGIVFGLARLRANVFMHLLHI